MAKYFDVRRFSTPTGTWTPLTIPIACSRVVIENEDTVNACKFRVDKDDSATEKTIPAGMELNINAQACCFSPGDVVGYLNPAAGAGPACVSFTR